MSLEQLCETCIQAYEKASKDFVEILYKTRTGDSYNETTSHEITRQTIQDKAAVGKNKIYRFFKQVDVHCGSQILLRKQAKLDASRSKFKYLEEEATVINKKTELDAQLKIRKSQCDIEMYEREVSIMKDIQEIPNVTQELAPMQSSIERTRHYVNNLESDQRLSDNAGRVPLVSN